MAAPSEAQPSADKLTNDGPVLTLFNKRLRALRKKRNRILQMEESLSLGKTLNKEQEETLRSKPSVIATIDALEKLRQPMLQAVDQEIQRALEKSKRNSETLTERRVECEVSSAVSDLLRLLYFGSMFDLNTLMRGSENMLLRAHERNCCLTYDYVTDDDAPGEFLKEWDLDWLAMMGGLLTSRPLSSTLSHEDSLKKCVERAKLWLANSDHPIEPNSRITYAVLKDKLGKIMASEYFTTTPELKAPAEVAEAVGNYPFQVQMRGSVIPQVAFNIPMEGPSAEYEQEEDELPNSSGNEIQDFDNGPAKELHQGGSEGESTSKVQAQTELVIPPGKEIDRGFANGHGGRSVNGDSYQNGHSQFYDQPAQKTTKEEVLITN